MSRFQKPFVSFSARFAANVLRVIQKDGAARLVSALVQQSTVVFLDPHAFTSASFGANWSLCLIFSLWSHWSRASLANWEKFSKSAKDYYNSSLRDKSIFILSIFILIYLHYLYIDINIILDLNNY